MQSPHLLSSLVLNNGKLVTGQLSFAPSAFSHKKHPLTPWSYRSLLLPRSYKIHLSLLDQSGSAFLERNLETDSFGQLSFRFPVIMGEKRLAKILLSTTSQQHFIAGLIPTPLSSPKKILVSDFDQTLIDTQSHSVKDIIKSLTSPLNEVPAIKSSVELFQRFTDHTAFILTASPHFYELPIQDWLYQHQLYNAGILTKDYRNFFSLIQGELGLKDLRTQLYYKLKHLLKLLQMTGIPQELVLMGDNSESDPLVYLFLAALLLDEEDPWVLLQKLNHQAAIELTRKQESQLLGLSHQLDQQKVGVPPVLRIFIRHKTEKKKNLPAFLQNYQHLIQLYS